MDLLIRCYIYIIIILQKNHYFQRFCENWNEQFLNFWCNKKTTFQAVFIKFKMFNRNIFCIFAHFCFFVWPTATKIEFKVDAKSMKFCRFLTSSCWIFIYSICFPPLKPVAWTTTSSPNKYCQLRPNSFLYSTTPFYTFPGSVCRPE